MSTKKIPRSTLTINDRFFQKVKSFWTKWKASKPALVDADRLATLAFATLFENTSAFNGMRKRRHGANNFPAGEPTNDLEHWVILFLKYPDFALGLLTELRKPKNLGQYDKIDIQLFCASAVGELALIDDAEILRRARGLGRALKNMSDDGVKGRRQQWTKDAKARDQI